MNKQYVLQIQECVPLACLILCVASIALILVMVMLSRSVNKVYCKIVGTVMLLTLTVVFGACFLNNTLILVGWNA
jgi:hypothetical protein